MLLLALGFPALAETPLPTPEALTVMVRSEGRPIAGASVRAGAEQAKTDASGQTTLTLTLGERDITVEADGFVPAVARLVEKDSRSRFA